MKSLSSLIILMVFLFSGCSEEPPPTSVETQPSGKIDKPLTSTQPQQEGRRPAVHPGEAEFEWDREEIADRHRALLLSELPDYAQDVRGVGGRPRDSGEHADWGFLVPKSRIAAFRDYLGHLGTPNQYMDKDSPFRTAERDSVWAPPSPGISQLIFLRSRATKADTNRRGLFFPKDVSRLYVFENPNLRNSMIYLRFDPNSGYVHIKEKRIDW